VRNAGMTLIELMVVITILGVLAAFAIPNLMETRKAANENNAYCALRTIHTAQELYNTRYSGYGRLSDLCSGNMLDSVLRDADSGGSASPKCGYLLTMTVSVMGWWCCVAYPSSWGNTGDCKYRITQNGVLYKSSDSSTNAFPTGGTPMGR
jgi:prepilin-type N-terminal cleavage/methylation domain-containing protein